MKKNWIVISIIVALTLVIMLFVTQTKKDLGEIKIGIIAPLTGEGAVYGVPPMQGIELAADEINSNRGINGKKIRLIIEDSRGNSQIGVSGAIKLITMDKVKVIIGEIYSSITMAIAPLAENNRIILFSPQSAAPYIKDAGEFVFRNWPSSEKEGEIAAQLAYARLKLRKAAVVFINNDYGVGVKTIFSRAFKDLGGNLVIEEGVNEGTTDFRTILAKIKQLNPDFIYLAAYLREGAILLIQAKEMGLNIKFIAPDSLHNDELIELAGNAAEDVIVTTIAYNPESSQQHIRKFVTAYKEKYSNIPNNYAAHGYDALMIIAQSIAEVGYDAEKIRDYLYQLKNYQGVAGNTSFDKNGDVIKPARITIIKQGQFQDYE